MEGMMKPVEIRFCTEFDANTLLASSDEMWQPHGNPFVGNNGVTMIALVKTIPIRFNVRNDNASNLVIPQLRTN